MYEFYSRHEEYWEDDTRLDEQLLRDINKAVNDEFSAIHYYTCLAELAPNNQFQQAILGIRQDEIKHFDWFSKAYYDLSGSYPQISLNIKLPNTFQEGVSESIKDEEKPFHFINQSLEESQMLEFKAALFELRAMNSATVKFSEPFSPTSHTK